MATTIKWVDNNIIESAHRIYKSSTYFDKDSLPAVLVELGPDVTEWVDVDGVDGENWYIVSALLNDYEVFSEPFITGLTTILTHDIFGDGSAIATYTFDGNVDDVGGTYNGTWVGIENYVDGVNSATNQSARLSDGNYIQLHSGVSLNTPQGFSISGWVSFNQRNSFDRIFSKGGENHVMIRWRDTVNAISFRVVNNAGSATILESSFTPTIGVYFHFTVSYNLSNNEMAIYINGVLDSTKTSSGLSDDSSTATVGSSVDSTNADVDQFRIFNRALTQQEVDILYQEGATL